MYEVQKHQQNYIVTADRHFNRKYQLVARMHAHVPRLGKGNYFVIVAYKEPATGKLRYDMANTFNVYDTIDTMLNINKMTAEEAKKLITYLETGEMK
jgi:hypothetical protein